MKKNPVPFSSVDVDLIVSASRETTYGLAFPLMAFCGLRLNEAIALEWSDISPDLKTLSVNNAMKCTDCGLALLPAHRNRQVTMVIPPEMRGELAKVSIDRRCGFVVRDGHGNPIPPATMRHNFEKVLSNAGIKRRPLSSLVDFSRQIREREIARALDSICL